MSSVSVPVSSDLPAEWEMRTTINGRVYFANHLLKTTQWQHPVTGKHIINKTDLPHEWREPEHNVKNDNTMFGMTYRFSESSTAMHVLKGTNLKGHVVVITGANSGIGFESAKALACHGAHVIMACRNMVKAQDSSTIVKNECQCKGIEAKVDTMHLDLASFKSVRLFAENYKSRKLPLHVLICNAAVLGGSWQLTEDHIERTFAINYLGHFLLIQLLQDLMVSSSPARIVMVSSESHRFQDFDYSSKLCLSNVPLPKDKYWSILAYNQSKLCILLLSMELNRRFHHFGVTSNAVHPGNLIYSSLCQTSWWYWVFFLIAKPFNKNPSQGAATVVYCAADPELEGVGGLYLNNCRQCTPSAEAMDQDKAKTLWDKSIRMIQRSDGLINTSNDILDI
ncbi:WW domain-containing oxidoreductase-like [Actinia tenebrosa]|uniref:WW domain-containing oxidoreductase n=1 Tax=Actinia tenebrosa TaxID=6105 RepID=A0A6P8IE80_ACTTE|nr:WW domain-containing oxidoreductase-like [Actinia tenebrosa]